MDKGGKFDLVEMPSTLKAIAWCEYLESHAARLYASGGTPEMDSAKALLKKIKKGDLEDGFSLRDVYYGKNWAKLSNRKEVEGAINVLQDMACLKSSILNPDCHLISCLCVA
ncbi:hypothetical protein SCG7109_AU_00010 [Chlamydiales bacterium SCGC AG-110-M15]|nr:hypothetical protein SCG7109_AU_00010 [Chlamydiales bacterium SCGC AG-110-M15]